MASRTIDRRSGNSRKNPPSTVSRKAAIPLEVQKSLQGCLERHARTRWSAAGIDLVVEFRGRFAYVGYLQRAREPGRRLNGETIPLPLFRLGFTGDTRRWLFALFRYSHEDFAPCLGASGSLTATPEQAFDCAARLYLS